LTIKIAGRISLGIPDVVAPGAALSDIGPKLWTATLVLVGGQYVTVEAFSEAIKYGEAAGLLALA